MLYFNLTYGKIEAARTAILKVNDSLVANEVAQRARSWIRNSLGPKLLRC